MNKLKIYDDVLENHIAELIHLQMKEVYWKYDYNSKKGGVNKHWHVLCGENENEVIQNGFSFVLPLWETAFHKYDFKNTYDVLEYKRVYLNAHTHGIEPHEHTDDGDFTMIYYPRLDWKKDWGGGTLVDGELVPYVGNRLIVFNAKSPHQAMPVSRQCYELRSVVVFKTYVEGANIERLDFYKD
jgi:Rps23 Pro-64 3,4-dihydroxylase Tpa1-like proline 4-hydroxylase